MMLTGMAKISYRRHARRAMPAELPSLDSAGATVEYTTYRGSMLIMHGMVPAQHRASTISLQGSATLLEKL
jgi:hypothetical protein